jgi:opacity protein-like surface antigen
LKNRLGLFLVSVPLLVPMPALCQSMWGIGVRAGVGFNDTKVETALRQDASSSDKTSFVVGLVSDFHLPETWSLQVEALYTRRETTLHFAAAQGLPAITSRYKLDFIEVPITVRYHFTNGTWQPYVFGGPNFGIRVNAKAESDSGGPTLTEDVGDQFRRMNVALEAGAGVRYRTVGRGAVTADVRYIYGLTDMAGNANDSWKIREVRVLLGFIFGL